MSTFRGTPGEWYVAYLDDNGQAVVKAEHTEVATCWHHCVGSIEKEMHANARLIAASPTMFEVVRKCRDTFRMYEKMHLDKGTVDGMQKAAANKYMADMCDAAIAKALGEDQ